MTIPGDLLLNIGPYTTDPRIAHVDDRGPWLRVYLVGGGHADCARSALHPDGELWIDFPPTGRGGAHRTVVGALHALLGAPRTLLVHALVETYSTDELAELHGGIDVGPEGESPAWDRLLAALAEAREG